MDQVFSLRQILERGREHNIQTHHLFVDFESAHDSVNRNQLYLAMIELGIHGKVTRMCQITMEGVECFVKVQAGLSDPLSSTEGLRQGVALACLLFNLDLEMAVRKSGIQMTGTIINRMVKILAYSDDLDIVGRSFNAIEEAFLALAASRSMGLKINASKTKYMVTGYEARQGACRGLYFPSQRFSLTVREGSERRGLANLTALLYSGRPAPAEYSISQKTISDVSSLIHVDSEGTLRWAGPTSEEKNLTATVDARYMANLASTEIHIIVLPPLKDPCKPSVQEVCFSGVDATEFQMYEESRHEVPLLDLTSPATSCPNFPQPKYTISGGEGRLVNGRLVAVPALVKGDFTLTVTCAVSKLPSLVRKIHVVLIPARVQLPISPTSVTKRLISNITQGSEVLLNWAVVKRDTPALLDTSNTSSSLYRLTLDRYNFTADLANASLLLVRLTWRKNSTERYVKVPIRILTCRTALTNPRDCNKACSKDSIDCTLELWTEVEVKAGLPRVEYPKGRLKVTTPSPYARIAQPNTTDDRVTFQAILPGILESPFAVTRKGGIVFLADWSVQALQHTVNQPGSLVEWRLEDREAGLTWLDISVATVNCSEWDLCSEALSEKTCVRASCRIAATPLEKGRCEWRSNNSSSILSPMTRNYATCSPDLTYCPDKTCDPLEELHLGLCSQDCTVHVSLGSLDPDRLQGIESGQGVCSCDVTGKCTCGKHTGGGDSGGGRQGRRQGRDEDRGTPSQPLAPPKLTSVLSEPGLERNCDAQCIALVVLFAAAVAIIAVSLLYISAYRSCILKKKGQGAREYSGHALLPLGPSEIRTSTPVVEALLHQHEIDPRWEVPRSRLAVEECLGEGEFGRVLRGTARDLPNNPGYTTVAVKTLKENAGTSELDDLMSEYQLLKEVSHPNVIKLLGACTTPGHPPYIIIEFCALGSLRAYLRRHRNIKPINEVLCFQNYEKITPRDVLSFAWQISKGMSYLTEIKLVHRDLAARNILLATGKLCKISDFGLTRDVYEDDTYLKKSRGRVPVKWMALESLSDHIYTSKSDVWSFGIVLWELVTLGSSPYPGVAVQNLYHLLKNGYRMQRPNNCSQQLYDIMNECWSANPPDRPSFCLLVDKFERMLEDGADYLDCNVKMVSNPAYFSSIEERGPRGSHEMDITFTMDLEETNSSRYENDSVSKETSYDVPKPILMSELLFKEEER